MLFTMIITTLVSTCGNLSRLGFYFMKVFGTFNLIYLLATQLTNS